MNYQYRVLYSIQYFGEKNNQYPHITNHDQYDSTFCLLTYLLKYVWDEINGLVQLWPWSGIGVELTGLSHGLGLRTCGLVNISGSGLGCRLIPVISCSPYNPNPSLLEQSTSHLRRATPARMSC